MISFFNIWSDPQNTYWVRTEYVLNFNPNKGRKKPKRDVKTRTEIRTECVRWADFGYLHFEGFLIGFRTTNPKIQPFLSNFGAPAAIFPFRRILQALLRLLIWVGAMRRGVSLKSKQGSCSELENGNKKLLACKKESEDPSALQQKIQEPRLLSLCFCSTFNPKQIPGVRRWTSAHERWGCCLLQRFNVCFWLTMIKSQCYLSWLRLQRRHKKQLSFNTNAIRKKTYVTSSISFNPWAR